ncbi:Na/Pi symporter [Halalkalibacterium halodurans]|uniref:BH1353 protein n=2 Tax=Halalkalibacterium halodurans TaxID=86665 RepID=Q9KD66_HALH5|nr:Na/Pi symporter [Halalkalibacterium halodurans]MED4083792.1 Na/Pi symporter [Halalkalibacterium halodurans]MED4105429.1 Na/Pi symporter [Halalkalibacterium halodurans]MED4109365.1 Na/Pi symporter [Halalkalibacterium halodurans]MED4122528.1 Na/Pi symporter [Halalkalibacterium halodurans]MED4149621.1 Na/Pi symporter [Halalkalibacterium halodurans]
MTQQLFTLFAVFISLFLFGMAVMRAGLLTMNAEKARVGILRFVDNPLKGFFVGLLLTILLQSSSAVMIVTIGFVAAGYVTFRQSIGIILGTNVGTCFTVELIALDLHSLIVPLLLIGLIGLAIPHLITYCLGCVSFGLACIFISMNGLENLASPLAAIPAIQAFIELTNDWLIVGAGVGTLLTALIQSSTATTAIAMGFLNEEIIGIHGGIAIMLGANIGTCFTALLASIGSGRTSRLVAFAHLWLNVIGVLLFIPLIPHLSHFVMTLTTIPAIQLAHASTIFNVICSLAILPFVKPFASFIETLHGPSQ